MRKLAKPEPPQAFTTGLFGDEDLVAADPWLIANNPSDYQTIDIRVGQRWYWKDRRYEIVKVNTDHDGDADVVVECDGEPLTIFAYADDVKAGLGPRLIATAREGEGSQTGRESVSRT